MPTRKLHTVRLYPVYTLETAHWFVDPNDITPFPIEQHIDETTIHGGGVWTTDFTDDASTDVTMAYTAPYAIQVRIPIAAMDLPDFMPVESWRFHPASLYVKVADSQGRQGIFWFPVAPVYATVMTPHVTRASAWSQAFHMEFAMPCTLRDTYSDVAVADFALPHTPHTSPTGETYHWVRFHGQIVIDPDDTLRIESVSVQLVATDGETYIPFEEAAVIGYELVVVTQT